MVRAADPGVGAARSEGEVARSAFVDVAGAEGCSGGPTWRAALSSGVRVRRSGATVANEDRSLNVLIVGEIRAGIERGRGSDPRRADALVGRLSTLLVEYEPRLSPVDLPGAER